MPSNRVYVDLIPKGGRVSKWNPSVTPVESLNWRKKVLLNSTIEEVSLTVTKKNLTYLLTPVSFTFLFKKKAQILEEVTNEKRRNLSFLFSGSPPPPVVTENLEWHRKLQSVDYNLAIVRVGRSLASILYTPIPTPPVPPEPVPIISVTYFRRYLNDVAVIPGVGPVVTYSTAPETALTRYLRRYLNNPL